MRHLANCGVVGGMVLLLLVSAPLGGVGQEIGSEGQETIIGKAGVLAHGMPHSRDTVPDEPPPMEPDTLPELPPPPDLDTIPDQEIPEAEIAPEDSIIPRNLPEMSQPVPPGWRTGIWEWDREGIQASRAVTLAELLEEVPGVLGIRGGDHGNPVTILGMGLGPGRVRVFVDGSELAPLDGGVLDLSRIGLVGLDRVRVERRMGEIRVHLLGMQMVDPRVYTLLEVGTGDLQTNLFRGTFAHPDALGGNVLLALDRIDTDGPARQEPGAAYGVHLRHAILRNEDGGLAWSVRRMTSRRTEDFFDPRDVNRTDWRLQGRYRIWQDILADGFYHHSSLGVGGDGADADTLITQEARSQVGGRLALDRGSWWAEAEARRQGGTGWPDGVQGVEAGALLGNFVGASASMERQSWDGEAGTTLHGRLWTSPVLGVSLFAEGESGRKAVPSMVFPELPAEEPPESGNGDGDEANGDEENGTEVVDRYPPRFQELTGFRVGAEFQQGDLSLGAAFLGVDPDSLHPTGLPFDRGGPTVAGGMRTGIELSGRVPLTPLLDGLTLQGEGQIWEAMPDWSYGPEKSWDVGIRYHNVFFDTRNLEVWTDVGLRGRDRMAVPLADPGDPEAGGLQGVPVNQSYYARVQIRVVSAKIFIQWDNFTFRDDNMDLPDRALPRTRVFYGVRWTLWN